MDELIEEEMTDAERAQIELDAELAWRKTFAWEELHASAEETGYRCRGCCPRCAVRA